MKIQSFEIYIFFENFSKSQIFEFSLTFSTIFFRPKIDFFLSQKIFDEKVFGFCRRFFFHPKFFGSPISIPNFPKIPKITLRKLYDDAYRAVACGQRALVQNLRFFVLNVIWRPSGWLILCIRMPTCGRKIRYVDGFE